MTQEIKTIIQNQINDLSEGRQLSIIDLVQNLVVYGYEIGASDIHIDPDESRLRVRFRLDGHLKEEFSISKKIFSEVISRIKILASLRTDEHQAAQDGRFRCVVGEFKWVDVRVSIVPTYFGENAVLRLLTDTLAAATLDSLDFSIENKEKILRAVNKTYGMILATGPTGSGKTTTLYSLIKMLNRENVSVVTIEDPVEYAILGALQIQVNSKSGLNFAQGLRAILRQDPDIIMVGEIRDSETARVATAASLTGHLLLSSLHTISPAAVLPRLLDMGVESYLVGSTVNLIIGQRLLRRICKNCRQEKVFTELETKGFYESVKVLKTDVKFFFGQGCFACNYTGYFGRIAIHEVLEISEEIREAILRRASAAEINKIAFLEGMVSLEEDAVNKALGGLTSPEEVLRINSVL